jgi:N-acetylglucosaminyldiphosphoundecaprenol N-acetyl-beta-D-mannosaminyltransferase
VVQAVALVKFLAKADSIVGEESRAGGQTEGTMSRIPRAILLGVGVSAINMEVAVSLSNLLLRKSERGYICVTGVHGVIETQSDL